jgi:catechol 2,3-dioxygenase-like lactoylglutathione lyase family enzyme
MRIDHLALSAPDPERSARFLADILGGLPVRQAGPEGEFFQVDLPDGSFLLFQEGQAPAHVAFQVERAALAGVVERLKAAGTAYGNDPEDPTNGRWEDPHGTFGRVYFADPAGHAFEVVAP